MKLDYQEYAEGEALLGWLNATAELSGDRPFDANALLARTTSGIRDALLEHDVEVAHLKLTLDADGTEIEGIAFNIDVPAWLAAPLETFHALYRLDVNEYRGERRAQLVIQSFWPCE